MFYLLDFDCYNILSGRILSWKQFTPDGKAFLKAKTSAAMTADLDKMSLHEFKMWSTAALKSFLAVRKRSVEGSFDELASR